MIETVFALLLIVNNEIVEHRIQPTLSDCLKGKRLAMRQKKATDRVIYQCIKSQAELEKTIDGTWTIKKLILQ